MNASAETTLPKLVAGIQERRKHERADASFPVRLRRYEPAQWRPGMCTDLCDGGMGLATYEPLKVGEIVEVEIREGDGSLTLRARVIYRQEHRYGLRFLDAASRER